MARRKKVANGNDLDEMDDGEEETAAVAVQTVLIEVPITVERPEYGECTRRVDLTLRFDTESVYVLASVRKALHSQHVQLRDGHHVETNADVVRWFLEQVEANAAA